MESLRMVRNAGGERKDSMSASRGEELPPSRSAGAGQGKGTLKSVSKPGAGEDGGKRRNNRHGWGSGTGLRIPARDYAYGAEPCLYGLRATEKENG